MCNGLILFEGHNKIDVQPNTSWAPSLYAELGSEEAILLVVYFKLMQVNKFCAYLELR